MTGNPLFAYGTLRDADVLTAVLGRVMSPETALRAHAPHWLAVNYPQRVYPALVPSPHGGAPGLLLYGLTPIELALLDAFEGGEYRRSAITVQATLGVVRADAYLPVISVAPDAAQWTLEHWTLRHKPLVLEGERNTAAVLRDRLSADKSDH